MSMRNEYFTTDILQKQVQVVEEILPDVPMEHFRK